MFVRAKRSVMKGAAYQSSSVKYELTSLIFPPFLKGGQGGLSSLGVGPRIHEGLACAIILERPDYAG